MTTRIQSLLEMLDERPDMDNSAVFDPLWGIYTELRAKLDARFPLAPDPATADLQPFEGFPGSEARGFVSGWSGGDVDWMIHSWIGQPKRGFINMHLTTWLGPRTRVPHLGFALGTIPDVFFYMDYVPRSDLMTDTGYLDRYYEPVNARSIALRQHPQLTPFISKSLYVRQALSETAFVYTCKPATENYALIRELAHEMLDRWLGWLDEAPEVPLEERPALAARDVFVRRTVAERDPANPIAVKLFGAEMEQRLVRTLWGGHRS